LLLREEDTIKKMCLEIVQALKKGNGIFLMGNGGSAAEFQHFVSELIGKHKKEKISMIPAIALTTNSSLLTSIANDISFDDVFSFQIEALVKQGDIVIGISTSGRSKNILKGLESAKKKNAIIISLTGKDCTHMSELSNIILEVPSKNTQRIQECHNIVNHIICKFIQESLME